MIKKLEVQIAIILFLLFSPLIYIALIALTDSCIEYSRVASIGGCNQNSCGTVLENGNYKAVYAPVIGKEVCSKSKHGNL